MQIFSSMQIFENWLCLFYADNHWQWDMTEFELHPNFRVAGHESRGRHFPLQSQRVGQRSWLKPEEAVPVHGKRLAVPFAGLICLWEMPKCHYWKCHCLLGAFPCSADRKLGRENQLLTGIQRLGVGQVGQLLQALSGQVIGFMPSIPNAYLSVAVFFSVIFRFIFSFIFRIIFLSILCIIFLPPATAISFALSAAAAILLLRCRWLPTSFAAK
jgi:hypothetical protein